MSITHHKALELVPRTIDIQKLLNTYTRLDNITYADTIQAIRHHSFTYQ